MTMSKSNYAAWHIEPEAFSVDWSSERKLEFFARYGILAPSGHNTQPWRIKVQGGRLLLTAHQGRHLPYSGAMAAEPYVSLGAYLETVRLAARGFGYDVHIEYSLADTATVTVALEGTIQADTSLLTAITHRVSNRHSYDTEDIPASLLEQVTQTDLKQASTFTTKKQGDITFLAEQTRVATETIMSDPLFRNELSHWVRNNLTKRHDGMPGFVQGIPTPPSLVAKHVIKHINVSKGQGKKDADRIANAPALILVLVKHSNAAAYLDAGRLYASICIRAQQQGLATSGVGAAAIDPATRQAIVEHFQLPYLPLAVIRIGHTQRAARHTPRWPLEAVMQ